jgi:hypothetical protein
VLWLKLNIGKRLKQGFFHFCERRGIHITPVAYESPIPDTRTLKDLLWQEQSKLVGIDINEQNQIKLLSLFSSRFKEEYERFPKTQTEIPYQYFVNNGLFESVDGEILYCMIRFFKPKRIIEIGSGNSTYLSAQAIQKNIEEGSHKCELISVEPYPNDVLKAGFPGLSLLMPKKVQDVPISEFINLNENDVLFIDSSHALKIGSDVQYEMLEVLPRLKKGVLVHFHDIFLPAEYPKSWVLENFRFLNEQYLLQAFLAFNRSFEVQWAGSYMHLRHPLKLESGFSSYSRDERWPGSFWIRKTE